VGKKGGRRSHHLIPRSFGGKVRLLFEAVGIISMAGPAISGVLTQIKSPAAIPEQIVYNYTGYSYSTGGWNSSQMIAGLTPVALGGVLVMIGKFLGRVIR
jgi:hypothetical protein